MEGQVADSAGPLGFFARRWRREIPLGVLFWRDMVVVGSALNLAAAFVGLMALGLKADLLVAMLIIHAPILYNIFLAASVWRTAERAEPARAAQARFGAALWLVGAIII
jgi:hypothetical protein